MTILITGGAGFIGTALTMAPLEDTLLNYRVAKAGITFQQVRDIELNRIYGLSNRKAVSDGLRVLQTILVGTRRLAKAGRLTPFLL